MMQGIFSTHSIESFIKQQTNESFYYDRQWSNILIKSYGYELLLLTTTNASEQITGFLPLCYINSPLTGKRLVSLPFSDHCPLLATDDTSAEKLVHQAIACAQEKRVKYLELRTGINNVLAKHAEFVESNLYVRWYIPLNADPALPWKMVNEKVRRQIKKSQKLDVQVRVAQNREDIMQYYQLHLQTRSGKHGMPSQPREFFLQLWDTFAPSNNIHVLLAQHQEKVVAGVILLTSGTTARLAYAASNEAYLHLAPNKLLFWEGIKWSCLQGFQTLDLGRTACANEGLMEFKRRWGAVQEPLPYYYYPRTAGLVATSETSSRFHLLTSCWKRLPLPMAEWLSSHLYGHLG